MNHANSSIISQSVNQCLVACVEDHLSGHSYTLTAIIDIYLTDTLRHVVHVNKCVDKRVQFASVQAASLVSSESLPVVDGIDETIVVESITKSCVEHPIADPVIMPSLAGQTIDIDLRQSPVAMVTAAAIVDCGTLTADVDDEEKDNALSLAVIQAAMCVVEPTPSFVEPMTPYDQSISEAAACIAAEAAAKKISDAAVARATEDRRKAETARTVADAARAKAEVKRMELNDERQRSFGDSETPVCCDLVLPIAGGTGGAGGGGGGGEFRKQARSSHPESLYSGEQTPFHKRQTTLHYHPTIAFEKNSDTVGILFIL